MKKIISKESHFIAHFLAKYADAYELLGFGTQRKTHEFFSPILKVSPSSFKRLRDEYDGFYSNRKGYPDVVNRKSRVEYKNQFESLNKDVYLDRIKSIIGIDKKAIEKRISRLAFNSNGWIMPSGRYGKSNNKASHEAQYGYGHEEWLFDISKLIDGYHYGFLEPIRKQQDAYKNRTFDVWLYTIDGASKKRYWVGEIKDIEVLDYNEAESVKKIYKNKGWLKTMENQILDCGANSEGFSGWKGVDLFNIKFKPKDILVNDPYYEIPVNHPIIGMTRYNFTHFKEEFDLSNSFKGKQEFIFNSKNNGDYYPTCEL